MVSAGTRGDGMRRANLSLVLRTVHREGPRSRAALTAATGLNRSTIADLVGELQRGGLVIERASDTQGRVGRPSPIVAPDPRVVAVAANPEVDALDLAAIALDGTILVRERLDQRALLTPERTAEIIAERLAAWRRGPLADARITGVGIAVPGPVRASDGLVREAPHLGWIDAPLSQLVTDATTLPAHVGNDAALGALAEYLFGAARGAHDVVYLNGGASGIGGAVIVGGTPLGGAGGYAGEFGQNRPGIVDIADRRAADGVLEDEVSRAHLLAAAALDGGDDAALARALASIPDVSEVDRQRRILATALANAANVLNPAVIVLGGFLAVLAARDLAGLDAAVRAQTIPACAEGLRLAVAELGEDRLLVGAAEAVFEAALFPAR
ncbi:ROK family transcriptional regulator [Microbacterium sp. CFBP 8790]|uniref:ROK family transcriptional regulator n=1 Tax=unclassified Microbacterium TaxID=2609290 RepID=UPI0017875BD6|nr:MULTISPECIES: ROK family transcriptional regulator [unclassified Microbacterium]MBD8207381.1 ROK family transcriptional regulator [Microbacterium sp. CFBP 8801]MBD8510990.1 ROK family transcriptional regulator [Microbacterium sp. CFBP 8790]